MNSRAVTAKILQAVLKDGQSLTAALAALLPQGCSAQERAFIQALCYGVVRHYFELQALLDALLERPLKAKDTEVKALALAGLYQLKYMRVKEHAAVSQTVAACKRQPWAKSLLNAVFRSYLRERENIDTRSQDNPGARYNHPAWLIARIRQDWPEQAEQILAANNQQAPLTLRVNLLRTTREAYQTLLAQASIAATGCALSPTALILQQPVPVEQLPQFSDGWASVQDAAAQLAAPLLALQPGLRVLDLCAAPGGKTCAILENQPTLALMCAVDNDAIRLTRVHENLQRLGLEAHVRHGDALAAETWWDGVPFDRILVDAPCSATGVIRRHPDIKLLRQETDIALLATMQQRILEQAWRLLIPGGILVYATCSLLKEENTQKIQQFLQQHPDAEELIINAPWGVAQPAGRQLLPGMHDTDGFYYARLLKRP